MCRTGGTEGAFDLGERDKVWSGQCWRGSYTVEAALVIPIVFLVLAALLIGTFYVHDRGVFQSMACETGASGSNFMTEGDRKKAVSSIKNQVKSSRFLGSKKISAAASAGEREVTALYTASYPIPGMVGRYSSGNHLPIQKGWNSQRMDPTRTIRLMRGAKRLIDGGTQ